METDQSRHTNRREFIRNSALLVTGIPLLPALSDIENSILEVNTPPDSIHIIGPQKGFSPQVGTLVSMLTWMQDSLVRATKDLTIEQLDYLHDTKANTIGSLMMHLAATEAIYQDMTFYEKKDLTEEYKKKWSVAMGLGDEARKQIKGRPLDYYLTQLKEVRNKSLEEFKKRDDAWLASVDPSYFGNLPTNNYCKWFHVCEHIGNHRGQISWIRKRLPGVKQEGD